MAFTRAAAVELAPDGIRVNAVLPGAVDTPALRQGLSRSGLTERSLAERTPMRRIGRPEEIGEAIGFLLDPERSGFITGHGLAVDGGALAALSTETT
jgi:NAD(P)-dependent dehydrogenase (short-subunit alcohol dehydrogenase family)